MQDLCIVQIQPRKHVLDHADYTDATRQHELDHTRLGIDLSAVEYVDREVGIDDLTEVWSVDRFLFSMTGFGRTIVLALVNRSQVVPAAVLGALLTYGNRAMPIVCTAQKYAFNMPKYERSCLYSTR